MNVIQGISINTSWIRLLSGREQLPWHDCLGQLEGREVGAQHSLASDLDQPPPHRLREPQLLEGAGQVDRSFPEKRPCALAAIPEAELTHAKSRLQRFPPKCVSFSPNPSAVRPDRGERRLMASHSCGKRWPTARDTRAEGPVPTAHPEGRGLAQDRWVGPVARHDSNCQQQDGQSSQVLR